MEHPTGEVPEANLRVAFDRRLRLEFHGSEITSDGGLLAYRELDHVLGLSEIAGQVLTDTRTGANGRHALVGQFRQSVFGRLAGYEDVNDAGRLAHDPAMRWVDAVHARRPVKMIVLDMDSRARHGLKCQPDLWRAGRHGLQWPLRLHLLSPAVHFQPVRRCGAVHASSGQRPLRRG